MFLQSQGSAVRLSWGEGEVCKNGSPWLVLKDPQNPRLTAAFAECRWHPITTRWRAALSFPWGSRKTWAQLSTPLSILIPF